MIFSTYAFNVNASFDNDDLFEELNILEWHESGYTGEGVTIGISEIDSWENGNSHAIKTYSLIRQIAPDAKIVYLNQYWNNLTSTSIKNESIDIISRSLTTNEFDFNVSQDRIKKLYERGTFITTPLGNEAYDRLDVVAENPYVWSVGSAHLENHNYHRASYSNFGNGSDSFVSYGFGTEMGTYSGTSSSTAAMSAMIALYYEHFNHTRKRNPHVKEVRDFIINNSYSMGEFNLYGYGFFKLPSIPNKNCLEGVVSKNIKLLGNKKVRLYVDDMSDDEVDLFEGRFCK